VEKAIWKSIVLSGLFGVASISVAQEKKSEEPSLQASKQPLWEVGVGLGGLRAPVYIGSPQNAQRLLPLPYLVYRG
jgi:MipA family protein